jgi:stage IV sporulation protein FB
MGGFHLFTLANVPVSVSPWYLLLLGYLTMRSQGQGLVLAVCITISLLVHEFGHALMARHFKLEPSILLHGFGGQTGHRPATRERDEALIIAAGPFFGLMLGVLAFVALQYAPIQSANAYNALRYFMYINFIWSVFNLLPMWPMDGGQLMRIGASKLFKPARGERVTHIVSIVVVVLVALGTYLVNFGPMMMIILAMTAWQNFQALGATSASAAASSAAPPKDNAFANELLERALRTYEQGTDDDEAARLCHQLRAEPQVPPAMLAKVWAILGVTTTRKGNYEEALSYLRRAPESPDVVEATAQCLYQLGMFESLEVLVNSKAFARLPNETRADIIGALADKAEPKPA